MLKVVWKGMILGCCLLLSACADKPQEPLRISAVLWPGYEPLYLASKLGYLDDQPVQLIDYLSNTDAMLAFRNHQLEAGAFTFDEVLQLLADGVDVQIVLVMDVSDGGDVILANPGISDVVDLKGRRVAVETSAVGAFVLARALQLHGMQMDDIQVVATNAMEQEEGFERGLVDAAVSFDPYRTRLLKQGKVEIFSSREIPNEIVDVFVVRRSYIKQHPEVVQHVVDAWYRALEQQRLKPREMAALSVNRFGTTVDDYIAGLKLMRFPSRAETRDLLDPTHSPLLDTAEHLFGVLETVDVPRRGVTLASRLNPQFVR